MCVMCAMSRMCDVCGVGPAVGTTSPTRASIPSSRFEARPLHRTIQRLVENQLSRRLLEGSLQEGDTMTVGLKDGRLDFDVVQKVGEANDDANATADSTPA